VRPRLQSPRREREQCQDPNPGPRGPRMQDLDLLREGRRGGDSVRVASSRCLFGLGRASRSGRGYLFTVLLGALLASCCLVDLGGAAWGLLAAATTAAATASTASAPAGRLLALDDCLRAA
jgi:hypothetical protein